MYKRLLPCSYPVYRTLHFRFSRLPVPYCCPGWCHWSSLSVIRGNLLGFPHPGTQLQSFLVMRWFLQVTVTPRLPSSMYKVCCPLLLYPMTIYMHIDIPYFLGFWSHLPPLGIFNYISVYFILLSLSSLSVSTVIPYSVILYCGLHVPQFWPGVLCLLITVFLISTVISMMTFSFEWFFVSGISTGNETGTPSDFFLNLWIFVEPSSLAWNSIPGLHWLRLCSL